MSVPPHRRDDDAGGRVEGSAEERREAGRALRAGVPRSAHADWDPQPDRPRPVRCPRAPSRRRVCRSWCRSATPAWPSRRSRSSAAARRSWPPTSPRRRPPGSACRRAATPTSPTSASSPRPSATSSSTSTTSTRRSPARGSGTSSASAPACTSSPASDGFSTSRVRRRGRRGGRAATASAWPSTPRWRTLELWYDRIRRSSEVIDHFPTAVPAQRRARRHASAERKDHLRAVGQAHRRSSTGGAASSRTRR